VFATDSTAAITQLTAARQSGIPAQALAAASMARLAASFAPDPHTGYRSLLECLRQEHGPLDRTLRDHTLAVADPDDGYHALHNLPGGAAVAGAWRARDTALRAYHHALAQQHWAPSTVLRTLLHEHHVRAVGVDPTFEKETGRLARAVALRSLALAGDR
jgi:thiopeptide-type bacteriocin biosynthesis protein